MLKICSALRDNIKALLSANLASWAAGHARGDKWCPAICLWGRGSRMWLELTRSASCRRSSFRKLIPSVEDGFRYAFVKQSGKLCGGQRAAKQIALTFRTVPRLEKCELFLRFDALSDHALL
jgi:hypothetical protein